MGAVFIILGIFLNGIKKAFNPKFKRNALIIINIGCAMTGIMLMIVGIFGTAVVQVFVILANLNGIRNCMKEPEEIFLLKEGLHEIQDDFSGLNDEELVKLKTTIEKTDNCVDLLYSVFPIEYPL